MAISESCGRGAIKASFLLPLLSVEAQGESSFRNITLIPDTTGIPCPGPSCLLGNSEAGAYWSGALWESAGSSDWSCCFYRSVSLPTGCQGFDEEDLLMAAWQGDAIEGLSPDGVSYAPLGHDMEVHPSSGEAQEETDESASSQESASGSGSGYAIFFLVLWEIFFMAVGVYRGSYWHEHGWLFFGSLEDGTSMIIGAVTGAVEGIVAFCLFFR